VLYNLADGEAGHF